MTRKTDKFVQFVVMKCILLITGFLILFAAEILRVYFIMPFPGSQHSNSIDIAYFLNGNIVWLRVMGILLVLPPLLYFLRKSKWWKKIILIAVCLFYAFVFYLFNFRFLADKMFYQPSHKWLADIDHNKVDSNSLVIGTFIGGQAKAYPIEIIGYHHQVRDTVGNIPVIVTYCTVCRTGRIFSPFINRKYGQFRLVGMDHFNAMFEDAASKSWWRQATGEAIAGPLKGSRLTELPSAQMRLGEWIRKYPSTLILQPDSLYQKEYDDLKGFDSGTITSSLEKRDSSSWNLKSWVIGVTEHGQSRAYDWNELLKEKYIQDTINHIPILLTLEKDSISFHASNRIINGHTLQFAATGDGLLQDADTHSLWNPGGLCISGSLKDSVLIPVQCYQEFWHSWSTFHPNTSRFLR